MDERGQVTVLILGFLMIVLATVGVAVDGTRAFMHRRALQNAADAAVLAAAGEIDTGLYYESGGRVISLQRRAAHEVAASWLRARRVTGAATLRVDASRVTLVVRDRITPGFLGLLGIKDLPVAVEAVAEPVPGSP